MGDFLGFNSAQKAAEEQAGVARESLAFAKESQKRAIAAAESPEELALLQESVTKQRRSIEKQARLFDALDPAILEASGQALKILRGEETQFLKPVREQQQRDERKLLARLRETLGPGAETSSAGLQALSNLRFQQGQQRASVQSQSLGQLFGFGQSGAAGRGALGGQIGQLAQIGQGFGNIASRRVSAFTGSAPAISQAFQQVGQTAGAGQVAGSLQGQFFQTLIGKGIEGATTAAVASDLRLKENISSGDPKIEEFLDSITVHEYNYRNPKWGKGRHVSVMAQDLEKTEVGKSMVLDTTEGKMIDYARGFALMLAANVNLNKRLRKLERT